MKGQGNLTCDVTPLSSSHWLDSITCSPRRVLIGHGILLLLTSGPVYGWRRSFLIDVILIDFPHWWVSTHWCHVRGYLAAAAAAKVLVVSRPRSHLHAFPRWLGSGRDEEKPRRGGKRGAADWITHNLTRLAPTLFFSTSQAASQQKKSRKKRERGEKGYLFMVQRERYRVYINIWSDILV